MKEIQGTIYVCEVCGEKSVYSFSHNEERCRQTRDIQDKRAKRDEERLKVARVEAVALALQDPAVLALARAGITDDPLEQRARNLYDEEVGYDLPDNHVRQVIAAMVAQLISAVRDEKLEGATPAA